MKEKRIILDEQDYKSLAMVIDKLRTTHKLNAIHMKELAKELESAQIGDINDPGLKNVTLKSKVTYRDLDNGGTHKASVVFPAFADSTKDLYSVLSPLGAALIGEEVGNITTCHAPAGKIKLKILEIENPVNAGE